MFRRLKFIIAGYLFGLSEAPKRRSEPPRSTSPAPESSRVAPWYSDAWTAMRSPPGGAALADASNEAMRRRVDQLDVERERLIRRTRAEADVQAVQRFIRWTKDHDIGVGLCYVRDGRAMVCRSAVSESELEDFLKLYVEDAGVVL